MSNRPKHPFQQSDHFPQGAVHTRPQGQREARSWPHITELSDDPPGTLHCTPKDPVGAWVTKSPAEAASLHLALAEMLYDGCSPQDLADALNQLALNELHDPETTHQELHP